MGEAGEGGKSHIQEAILKGSSTVTRLCVMQLCPSYRVLQNLCTPKALKLPAVLVDNIKYLYM